MLTNSDATLYSRHRNGDTDTWERTYIPDVWWYKNEKSSVTTEGLKTADIFTVRIPDLSIEIKKDDRLVKGKCEIDIVTIRDLKYSIEQFKVTSVNYNRFFGNPHIKVGGV